MPSAFTHVPALVPTVKVFLGRALNRQVSLNELVRVVPGGVISALYDVDEEQTEVVLHHGNTS